MGHQGLGHWKSTYFKQNGPPLPGAADVARAVNPGRSGGKAAQVFIGIKCGSLFTRAIHASMRGYS